MNCCIAAYWKPVYAFVRAKGFPVHRAEELTQDFFLNFFSRDWIRLADERRGRFRTFLLTILVRFLSDESPARRPRQKTFDEDLIAVSDLRSDSRCSYEPPDHQTPQDVFMREWAKAVMSKVQKSLELWCFLRGRPDWYRVFLETYFQADGGQAISQQELASRLETTREKVRYALSEVHRQFTKLLREEIAEQSGSDCDIEAEIGEILSLLNE